MALDLRVRIELITIFGTLLIHGLIFQLAGIEKTMKESGETILTPLVSLDTPGKATVQVVILADPLSVKEC